MASPRYQLFLRDSAYALVDEIREWSAFSCVTKFNAVGTWRADFPRFLPDGTPHPVTSLITKKHGIVLRRDGVTIFSGRIATKYTVTAQTLSVAGFDDMVLLDVPALPDVNGPPYNSDYGVVTAVASTAIRLVVNAQIGPSARPDRAISNLTFGADPLLGASVTARARFNSMLTMLASLSRTAMAGGLRFTLLQSDTTPSALAFNVSAPADRTADAKFSVELGTVQDFDDTQAMPGANYVYVLLGDGLGTNRSILEDGDDASIAEWGWQREAVVDMRDVTDTSEGNQRLAEALAGVKTTRKVSITPFEILAYGTDYDMGDLVQFIVNGVAYTAVIREVTVENAPERGWAVTPLIGDDGATDDGSTAQQIAAIQGRLTNVEMNWNVPDDSITAAMMTDAAVTPNTLWAMNGKTDTQLPAYDAATGLFKWTSISTLVGTITNLSVAGTITAGSTVQGTRLISTVATGTAPLTVASTTVVPNLNASQLNGFADTAFAKLTGAAFTGAVSIGTTLGVTGATTLSGDLAVSGNGLVVTAASNKVRINTASVTGWDLTVGSGGIDSEGSVVATKVSAGAASFSGSEVLRAVGTTRLEGAVTVTTGDLTLSTGTLQVSAGNISVQGGTAGQIRVGGVIIGAASFSGSENLRVAGSTRLEGAVTVTTGGVNVTGSSVFNSGVSLVNSDLTMNGTGRVDHSQGSTAGATVSAWDGYVEMKHNGAVKKFYYKT